MEPRPNCIAWLPPSIGPPSGRSMIDTTSSSGFSDSSCQAHKKFNHAFQLPHMKYMLNRGLFGLPDSTHKIHAS